MDRRQFLATTAAATAGAGLAAPLRAAQHDAMEIPTLAGAQRFAIGDRTLTALSDGGLQLGAEVLQGIDQSGYDELMEAGFHDPASYRASVNAFLVEGGEETVLIDAGGGTGFSPDLGRMSANLAQTGVAPEDVTTLLITHMHPDHLGGALTDGSPTYPNARLLVSAAERDFWTAEETRSGAPEQMRGMIDSAVAVLDAYGDRVETFEGEADVVQDITAMPLPGHTPGHTGFMIGSGADGVLIWTDIIHVPPVQLARPEVTIGFDVDPEAAAATRAELLDRVVADRLLIAGSHMGYPGLAHIEAAGEGYRAIPAPYDFLYSAG